MNRTQLNELVAEHNLKIDDTRQGAGKFIDVHIGTGASYEKLNALKLALASPIVEITRVDNPNHPDFPKLFLILKSFWNE